MSLFHKKRLQDPYWWLYVLLTIVLLFLIDLIIN